jgi:hypothetical protein
MSESTPSPDGPTSVETLLGQTLVLLHRAAGRLDEPARRNEVQAALQQAATCLAAARQALSGSAAPAPLGAQKVSTGEEPAISAVIAAAVSVYLDRPFRLVSVQRVTVPVVPHLNVWAVEGRTQIFMSHRVR